MNHRSVIVKALSDLLNRENDDAFLILEDRATKKFVQFIPWAPDKLYMDLPYQTLSEAEFHKAVQCLRPLGVSETTHQVVQDPENPHAAEQFSFNTVFDQIDDAVDMIELVFTKIYGFAPDFDLNVIEH